jgi:hypothetical protein
MGRKPTRERKHFYLCLAGLILSACVTTQPPHETPPRARADALVAEHALARGDFAEVISESQQVLASEESRVPSDIALFTLGIVYAHPQNPAKNSVEAMSFFTRLINEHPHSPWSLQARVWLALLKEQENLAESNTKLQEENTALDYSNKKLKDEQESFAQAQKKLRDENDNLQQVIKKMKQVDIEIEEKKREKAR